MSSTCEAKPTKAAEPAKKEPEKLEKKEKKAKPAVSSTLGEVDIRTPGIKRIAADT